jgi:beta-lactamase regulating signal transducer with metallopeptidase domain
MTPLSARSEAEVVMGAIIEGAKVLAQIKKDETATAAQTELKIEEFRHNESMFQLRIHWRVMFGVLLLGAAGAIYTYHLQKTETATYILTSTISLLVGLVAGGAMVKKSQSSNE